MGTTMWAPCVQTGTTSLSSTSREIASLQHVSTHTLSYTSSFQQPHGFDVVRPQSTALITTITHVHHFAASVVAAKYTESKSSKVGS